MSQHGVDRDSCPRDPCDDPVDHVVVSTDPFQLREVNMPAGAKYCVAPTIKDGAAAIMIAYHRTHMNDNTTTRGE